jgi:hypothetical protein
VLGPRHRQLFADLHQEQNEGSSGQGADFDFEDGDWEDVPVSLGDTMPLGDMADAVMDAIYDQ